MLQGLLYAPIDLKLQDGHMEGWGRALRHCKSADRNIVHKTNPQFSPSPFESFSVLAMLILGQESGTSSLTADQFTLFVYKKRQNLTKINGRRRGGIFAKQDALSRRKCR